MSESEQITDDDLSNARSDYVLDHAWDEIVALHVEHDRPIGVYVKPAGRMSGGKSQTAITLAVISPEVFDRLCARLVKIDPGAAEVLAAPHKRELVKIVYVEEPSGRTRVLALPAPIAKA